MGKCFYVGIGFIAVLSGLWVAGCPSPVQRGASTGTAKSLTSTEASSAPASPQPPAAVSSDETKQPDLHLFVPCGMIIPFNAVKKVFQEENGVRVKITYDNAVVLVRKIRKGQRPDILITPGITEMNLMKQEGYIDGQDVTTFGSFELVVVVPKANPAGITSIQDLAEDRVKSIAMADPKENSVGYYGQKALQKLGLWEKVKPKLKMHWHALTTVEYVCGGKVDVGLYYRACPFDTAPEKIEQQTWKFAGEVPPDSYPQIQVQAGILKEASHRELAQKFVQFLLTDATQKLLVEKGIPNYKRGEIR